MDLREQIDAYIEKYKFEIVSRTCDFVKIPSVSTSDDSGRPYGLECARALDFCDALCREKGLFTKNYDYYCLEASCEKEQKGKRLVLVTHADVVPVGEDTIYEPFAGTVYGDYILGRGCVDDKGPLIATLYALAFFKENHIPLKNDIRLVFGSNEERTMDDIEYYLERAGQPDWALAADGDFPAENGEMGRIDFTVSAEQASQVEYIRSRGTGQSLVQEACESLIENRSITIRKTPSREGGPEGVENPVAYMILNQEGAVFKNDADEKHMRELLADGNGASMGVSCSDEIFDESILRVYKAETEGENIKLSFDLRIPHCVDLEETAEKIRRYGEEKAIAIEIGKISKGYYESPDEGIVKMLTDLYNHEMHMDEKPCVLHTAATYTRLFEHGCDFGAGNCQEVKPFPPGHGSVHGLDEAQNIGVLLDAVKMYILGIKAIDDLWS